MSNWLGRNPERKLQNSNTESCHLVLRAVILIPNSVILSKPVAFSALPAQSKNPQLSLIHAAETSGLRVDWLTLEAAEKFTALKGHGFSRAVSAVNLDGFSRRGMVFRCFVPGVSATCLAAISLFSRRRLTYSHMGM